MKNSWIGLFALGAVAVCSWFLLPVKSEKQELAELVSPSSEYYREVRRNGYIIGVNYLPLRYFELRGLTSLGRDADRRMRDSVVAEASRMYGRGLYFMVTLAHEDKNRDVEYERIGNFGEYSSQLQKFLFQMGEYITLETAQEKDIRLSVYDFERTFGYTKHRKMLICFPDEFNGTRLLGDQSDFLRLHFAEFGFGIGKQEIEWDIDDLD
jgi:hypothetical protein